jgi:hypothetical protein
MKQRACCAEVKQRCWNAACIAALWEVLHGQHSTCGHSWTAAGCLALQLTRLHCFAVIINFALSISHVCELILLYVLHNACMMALIVTLMARATSRQHRSTVQTLTDPLNITFCHITSAGWLRL